MEEELEEQEEDIWIKMFSSTPSFKQYQDYKEFPFNCESRFNTIFSKNNLSRIKHEAYMIKLDDKKSKGIYLVSLFIDRNIAA